VPPAGVAGVPPAVVAGATVPALVCPLGDDAHAAATNSGSSMRLEGNDRCSVRVWRDAVCFADSDADSDDCRDADGAS
jgi:hypothetical protein